MMRSIQTLALVLLLASCQSQQSQQGIADNPQSKDDKKPIPIYIGTIQQVYPEHHFALIRVALQMVPKPGTILIAHPSDGSTQRLANLCVSAEQIRNSVSRAVAADIRGGTAMQGDAVYLYQNLSPLPAKDQDPDAVKDAQGNEFLAPVDNIFPDEESPFVTPTPNTPLLNAPTTPAVVPTVPTEPTSPAAPSKNKKPTTKPNPSYIDQIPDNIKDWDTM